MKTEIKSVIVKVINDLEAQKIDASNQTELKAIYRLQQELKGILDNSKSEEEALDAFTGWAARNIILTPEQLHAAAE